MKRKTLATLTRELIEIVHRHYGVQFLAELRAKIAECEAEIARRSESLRARSLKATHRTVSESTKRAIRKSTESDSATARKLGVCRATVRKWRGGRDAR